MAQNFIEKGKRIVITASSDLSSGDLVLVNDLAVVAAVDIADGEIGAAYVEGVFELPKANVAVSQGEKAYRIPADGKVTNVETDNDLIGIFWADAIQAATLAHVKINA